MTSLFDKFDVKDKFKRRKKGSSRQSKTSEVLQLGFASEFKSFEINYFHSFRGWAKCKETCNLPSLPQ